MEINTLWPPRRGASSRVTWVWGVGVMGQSLTTKMSHAYRQPVMAGLGGGAGLEGPGTLYAPAESKLRRVETPFPLPPPHPSQCPPPHWGCPGRLHRCWHPNEKVNIEPKDLGVVEQLGAPREEVPVWDHLGSPTVYQRERAPSTTGEGTDWGTGQEKLWGLITAPMGGEGPFGYVVF